MQLPTAAAHEYHLDTVIDAGPEAVTSLSGRLHPSIAQKIRELVSGGELRQYFIRHLLRSLMSCNFCFHLLLLNVFVTCSCCFLVQ